MSINFRQLSLATLITLALCASPVPAATEQDAPLQASRQTISDTRNIGAALYAWLTEQERPEREVTEEESPGIMDWSQCPPATAEAIAKHLVPDYLATLPASDGWGKTLEFCLDANDDGSPRSIGVRSSGSDGEFSGDIYTAGAFPVSNTAHDIVWMDGYFVTWPSADAGRDD